MSTGCAGIVGGLGPESTIDYYRRIIDGWRHVSPGSAPSLVIVSVDVDRALSLLATDREALVEYLLRAVRQLASAGATFGVISANTPHIVFDEVQSRTDLPLVSMIDAVAASARARGMRRVGVLGTRFTMEAPFYPTVLGRQGIEMVLPPLEDRQYFHDHYLGELVKGVFRDETRAGMTAVVERLRDAHAVDGVVLAGTELPIMFTDDAIAVVSSTGTPAIHVGAILARLRAEG
jgi:aspartate racemase